VIIILIYFITYIIFKLLFDLNCNIITHDYDDMNAMQYDC
jgi:hypothetical protein